MPIPKVEFITKEEGCSLCDDAFAEIESARDYAEFDLEIVKIREGDEYFAKYWDKIPVILINGKMAFKYSVDRDQLIRKLESRKSWQFWKKD